MKTPTPKISWHNPEKITILPPKGWRLITEEEFEKWDFKEDEVLCWTGTAWSSDTSTAWHIGKQQNWSYITNRPLPDKYRGLEKGTSKKPPVAPKSYTKQSEDTFQNSSFPPIPSTESQIHEAVGKAYLQGLRPNAILLPEGAYKAFCEEMWKLEDPLLSYNGMKLIPTVSSPILAIEMVEQ